MSRIYTKKYRQFLQKLRGARLDAKLTQTQVGRKLRQNQNYVSKCELGERRVDFVELAEFAKLYKKPLTYFQDWQ